ncbi:MAG: oligosaccharide repeat unit polymerase [Bacilli bacterium]|nr:oligosaccharide repeat unit polymerase [Bacilli bacterium]
MARENLKEIKIKHPIFINPFWAYSLIWTVVLLLYYISPSELNKGLKSSLIAFFVLTIFISFLLGCWANRRLKNRTIKLKYCRFSRLFLFLLVLIYLLEILYSKTIPLLSHGASYKEFGIPTIHVLIVNISLFYFIYRTFLLINFFKKGDLLAVLVPLAYFCLIYSRGLIIFALAVTVCLFFIDKTIKKKYIVLTAVFGLIAMLAFGALGNIRSGDKWNDTTYLMALAHIQGNPKSIGSMLYWVEEYLTCSLRNLNYNLGLSTQTNLTNFLYCITPDFIAKRIFGNANTSFALVVPAFTTGTAFVYGYNSLGITGMIIQYVFYMAVPAIILNLRIKSEYKIMCLAILFFLYAMSMFDNMLFYSGYSFVIIIVLLYPIFVNLKRAQLSVQSNRCNAK